MVDWKRQSAACVAGEEAENTAIAVSIIRKMDG